MVDVAGPPVHNECRELSEFDSNACTKFSFSNFSFKVSFLHLFSFKVFPESIVVQNNIHIGGLADISLVTLL